MKGWVPHRRRPVPRGSRRPAGDLRHHLDGQTAPLPGVGVGMVPIRGDSRGRSPRGSPDRTGHAAIGDRLPMVNFPCPRPAPGTAPLAGRGRGQQQRPRARHRRRPRPPGSRPRTSRPPHRGPCQPAGGRGRPRPAATTKRSRRRGRAWRHLLTAFDATRAEVATAPNSPQTSSSSAVPGPRPGGRELVAPSLATPPAGSGSGVAVRPG